MRLILLNWSCTFLLACWCLLVSGCEQFDFSPYQVNLKEDQLNLNKKIDRIAALNLQPQDTLQFALISDNQRFYDELEEVVKAVNNYSANIKTIAFVANCGDLTDFSLQEEYI